MRKLSAMDVKRVTILVNEMIFQLHESRLNMRISIARVESTQFER